MRRDKNEISQMSIKRLQQELARADSDFWAWQVDGTKPGYACEAYAEDLSEELKNRGHGE